MNSASPQQEFNLRDYWQILVRRRWMILTSVLVITLATAVSSFLATPVYRSTATIAIERQGAKILGKDLTVAESSWLDYQNFYNTQYKILASEAVIRRAIDKLQLENRPALQEKLGMGKDGFSFAALRNKIFKTVSRSQVPDTVDDPLDPYVKLMSTGLSIDPVRDSHLVQISFVSADRAFAAEAANAVADAYSVFTLAGKLELAKQSTEFFVNRISELQREVESDELKLQEYAQSKGIVTGTGDSDEMTLKNLDSLREKHTTAQAELAGATARLQSLVQTPAEAIDEVRRNPLIESYKRAKAEAEQSYRKMAQTYGDSFPEVLSAKAAYDTASENLDRETKALASRTIEGARAEVQRLQREVAELGRLKDNTMGQVTQLKSDYIEYLARKAEVERKRQTVNDLLERRNSMELTANLGETGHNVRIIDKAKPAQMIYKPKKKLNILLGFLFGLFLGIGAAVLLEYIDNTLKTPEDVRDTLGMAVLGLIPAQLHETRRAAKKRAAADAAPAAAGRRSREPDPALVTAQQPLSPVAEAYRELRTAVLLATAGHPPRDITVTSCQPSEGKTTTAINLAIALGQLERKVLLVDTDLRRPRCHQVLRTPASRGVSNYLTGMSELRGLIQPTTMERVWILPAGPIPPNPAELLDSERFRELIGELRGLEEFDHIIFDSPPVLSVVDPLLIGRHTDGTVLVVKSAFTSREAGRLGRDKLAAGRVTALGVVLNAVQTEHVPYQYRYYRYGYVRRDESAEESGGKEAAGGSGSS